MKIKPAKEAGNVMLEVGPGESRLLAKQAESSPVFRLKRILAPIDFSECSSKALQYAVPFCAQFQASLTLLYVIEIPYGNPEVPLIDLDQWQAEMRQNGERKLMGLSKGEGFRSIATEPIIRMGSPYREILQTAKDKEIDLIVLATHGHSGFSRFIMGSTAERVVRHASCPVLVVREHEHEHDFVEETKETKRF